MTAAQLKRLDEMPIDHSDIPEFDEEFFENAKVVNWPPTKSQLTIRLDADVLAWLKSNGRAHQSNPARRDGISAQTTGAKKEDYFFAFLNTVPSFITNITFSVA